MNSKKETDSDSIDSRVWDLIPSVAVDPERIRQRGRLLRRRRRVATAAASVAALALISVVTWGALNGTGPDPQTPATSVTERREDSTSGPSPTEVTDPASSDGRTSTGDEAPSGDEVETPRLQEAELAALATDAGLSIDRMTTEGSMLDGGFLDPTGAYVAVTITVGTVDEVAAAVEHGVRDRPYVEVMIAGHAAYYREPSRPGEDAHWLLTSTDGTQMISVNAMPPGSEADGNSLPASVTSTVERVLIPGLAET